MGDCSRPKTRPKEPTKGWQLLWSQARSWNPSKRELIHKEEAMVLRRVVLAVSESPKLGETAGERNEPKVLGD
jgi:hypothetical protein